MTTSGQYTDLTYLNEISGGDSDFINEIIELFINQMPQSIEDMKKGYQENDPVTIGETAHKAKPSAIYIGNKTLENHLKSLQDLKKSYQLNDEAMNMINEVESLSNKIIEELKTRGTESN